MIVDGVVVDERAHAEGGAGVGLGREFTAQPAQRVGFQLLLALLVAAAIGGEHRRIVIATDLLLQAFETLMDDRFCAIVHCPWQLSPPR